MKSHVRENQAKNIIASQMKFTREDETGYDIEFAEMVKEIIRQQAPTLSFSKWRLSKDDVWSAEAHHIASDKVMIGEGDSINAVIKDAISKL